jgi:hypothetical protein
VAGERPAPERHAQHVRAELRLQLARRRRPQRPDRPQHPRVVHPQVDAPEPPGDVLGEPVDRGGVTDVDGRHQGIRSPRRRYRRLVAGAQAERHPPLGEPGGQAGAEAPAGAGDDRHLPHHVGHIGHVGHVGVVL